MSRGSWWFVRVTFPTTTGNTLSLSFFLSLYESDIFVLGKGGDRDRARGHDHRRRS